MGNETSSLQQNLYLKHGIYKGAFLNGIPEGIGMLTSQNGDMYKGVYKQGKLVKGRCLFNNGDFYLGCW